MLKCSQTKDAFEAIELFVWRLQQNCYESEFIIESIKLGLNRYLGILKSVAKGERPLYRTRENRKNNKKKYDSKPPVWLHSSLAQHKIKVKKIIKKKNLNIKIRVRAGTSIEQILSKKRINDKTNVENNNKCKRNNCAACNLENPPTNVLNNIDHDTHPGVYQITCLICHKKYIGETKLYMATRCQQHVSAVKNQAPNRPALAVHYMDEHLSLCNNPQLSMSSMFTMRNTVKRKTMEALLIRKHRPQLNVKWEQINKARKRDYLNKKNNKKSLTKETPKIKHNSNTTNIVKKCKK